jgi:hypothetical protein
VKTFGATPRSNVLSKSAVPIVTSLGTNILVSCARRRAPLNGASGRCRRDAEIAAPRRLRMSLHAALHAAKGR